MVIVNADDFGYSPEVNEAIKILFIQRFISSTTLMANMPAVKEAVAIAKENGFEESVGFHFNLIEGVPLTDEIKQCPRFCTDGRLSYKRNSVLIPNRKEREAIRKEFKAQLDIIRGLGIEPSHMDSHQHVHTEMGIYMTLRNVMKKEGIRAVRIGRNVGVSRLSKIYKLMLNAFIRWDGFKTVDYFNPLWQLLSDKEKSSNIEYMCHPTLTGGRIVDAFSDNEFSLEFKINNLVNYRNI